MTEPGPPPADGRTVPDTPADEAVAALFRSHYEGLRRLAWLAAGDTGDPDDIVQDAFAGLYARWGRLRSPDAAVAYLRSAVLNRARSAGRRHRTRLRLADPAARALSPAPPPDPADAGAAAHRAAAVAAAVRALPDRQRDCVLLRYFADLSEAETARTLGVSPGTVKTSVHRALTRLRPVLEGLR